MRKLEVDDFVTALRSAAPYVHSHRGARFVIAVPGEAAACAGFTELLYDIALLHSMGAQIVLVHGARPQIEETLSQSDISTEISHGTRITSHEALQAIKGAVGSLRIDIEALLSTSLANTPMGGAKLRVDTGNLVIAKPVGVRNGIDHQFTGEVRRIDAERIAQALQADSLVLVSPLGYSPTGEVFNLRYEEVAASIALSMGARKLVYVMPGLTAAGQYSPDQAVAAFPANAVVQRAANACRDGISRVHLINSEQDGSLLRELYSRDGAGMLIFRDDYEVTRQACIDDVGGILALIAPLEEEGALVQRSREQLELEIDRFHIMTRDNTAIACGALYPMAEDGYAELACLAVHPDYRGQGRAEAVLKHVEQQARAHSIQQLFVLTTQAHHWFTERGFRDADIDSLPLSRREMYNYQRNSRVLIKSLAGSDSKPL